MNTRSESAARGWVVVSAALTINLILGMLYAWSVIGKALVVQWGWNKTQAAMPFTVATVAFAITMIFAGRLQDRIGPRLVAAAGGVFLGVGLVLSSQVSSPAAMLVTFGLVGGIGIGLGYSATTPPSIKWFPARQKGLITGLVVSGVGLAAVYVSPLAEYLLQQTSIERTFLSLGLAAIVLVAILAQLLANPPAGYQPENAVVRPGTVSAMNRVPGHSDKDWHEMIRTSRFYVLWVMFILGTSAGLMLIAHVAIIGKEQAGLQWGFMPVAMLAIFNTVGRVVSGYVSDRIGRTQTMALAFSLQAVNMFLFPFYTTPGLLVFGASFTGLCYGGLFTLMPAATADHYGVKNLGVNYGILFTAFGVAGVLGPILAGQIRDGFGSYRYAFLISGVLLVIGAVLAFVVRTRPETQGIERPGVSPRVTART